MRLAEGKTKHARPKNALTIQESVKQPVRPHSRFVAGSQPVRSPLRGAMTALVWLFAIHVLRHPIVEELAPIKRRLSRWISG